jgi:predicted enzyme related to lactoylglutathione lyase
MTSLNPVAHVEIPVTDLERAMRFYGVVFGVSFTGIEALHGSRMAHFPFEEGREGASVALAEGDVYVPTLNGAVVYFSVHDIDAVVARAEACGSEVLFPKSSVSGGAFVAEIRDSEGNRIALQTVTTGT